MWLTEAEAKLIVIIKKLTTTKDKVTVTMISKYSDITYSHVKKVVDKFESMGLVHTTSTTRYRYIRLSSKGEKLAELCDEVFKILGERLEPEEMLKKREGWFRIGFF